MEGFAVAVGGRGGMAKRVVLDIGYYLQKSGSLTYDSIITNEGFYKEDASMTYPIAGLYNAFLLKELGGKGYIDHYKNANSNLDFIKTITSTSLALPDNSKFDDFLKTCDKKQMINLQFRECLSKARNDCGEFVEFDSSYCFNIECNYLYLFPEEGNTMPGYESRLYEERTNKKYNDAVFLLNVDSSYVKVYNCYSNEIIFSYDINFSLEHLQVPSGWPQIGDFYVKPLRFYSFSLAKSVFDVKFSTLLIVDAVPVGKPKK